MTTETRRHPASGGGKARIDGVGALGTFLHTCGLVRKLLMFTTIHFLNDLDIRPLFLLLPIFSWTKIHSHGPVYVAWDMLALLSKE